MSKYNTNLASEFHVLSMLHRLHLDAYLTLGNKKSVDIVVIGRNRRPLNLEVKGVERKDDWTIGKLNPGKNGPAFVVLVSFENKLKDHTAVPKCWIVPVKEAVNMVTKYETRNGYRFNIKRTAVHGKNYEGDWKAIQNAAQQRAAADGQTAKRRARS